MTKDKDRAAFEKWFLGNNPTETDKRAVIRNGEGYDLMKTRCDWIAWQAARDYYAPMIENLMGTIASQKQTHDALINKLREQPMLTEAQAVEAIDNAVGVYCTKWGTAPDIEETVRIAVKALAAAGVQFKDAA